MDNLEITARLKTPFITGGGYMTLDALLAGILFDQLGDIADAHAAVPIRNNEGLFHASAAIYESFEQGRTAFIANLRADHALDPDLILKKKDGAIHHTIGRTRQRDFGAVMNSYDSISTESITWFVEGDAEKIERLLQPISFIGKRRASGFGEIADWQFQQGEMNGLVGMLGEPLRPIPVEMFKGDENSLKVDAGWRPAYWHPNNRAICYAPEMSV